MKLSSAASSLDREALCELLKGQAELHLRHNIGACRTRRDAHSKRLFRRGMLQAIGHGVDFALEVMESLEGKERPMGQILLEHKLTVLETCQLLPYKAVHQWGLTELEDKLDFEKESVICGVHHGLMTVAQTLPRLLKTKKKGPKTRALRKL